jgi:hypothetical protein
MQSNFNGREGPKPAATPRAEPATPPPRPREAPAGETTISMITAFIRDRAREG